MKINLSIDELNTILSLLEREARQYHIFSEKTKSLKEHKRYKDNMQKYLALVEYLQGSI